MRRPYLVGMRGSATLNGMLTKPGNGPQVTCLIGAEPRAARPEYYPYPVTDNGASEVIVPHRFVGAPRGLPQGPVLVESTGGGRPADCACRFYFPSIKLSLASSARWMLTPTTPMQSSTLDFCTSSNKPAEASICWRRYLALDKESPWASRAKQALKFCEMQIAHSS
jgi:hypothetical protein